MRTPSQVLRSRWSGRLGAAVVALSCAAALAACGGGSSSSASPTTTARGSQLAAFRQCMSAHGVNLPQRAPRTGNQNGSGGQGTPQGSSQAGGQSAAPDQGGTGGQAGAGGRGGGGGGGGGGFGGFGGFGGVGLNQLPPGVTAEQATAAYNACQDQLPAQFRQGMAARQAYTSCMKDHGVTIPAPGQFTSTTIDPASASYKAADAICRPLLPARPAGGGPGGGGGRGGAPTTTGG